MGSELDFGQLYKNMYSVISHNKARHSCESRDFNGVIYCTYQLVVTIVSDCFFRFLIDTKAICVK
jgi:hypothetical protein